MTECSEEKPQSQEYSAPGDVASRLNDALWDKSVSGVVRKVSEHRPNPGSDAAAVSGLGNLKQAVASSGLVTPTRLPLPPVARHIAGGAAVAGVAGALAGATGEMVGGYREFRAGEISGGLYAGRVAYKAAETGAAVSGRTVAALVLQEGSKAVAKRLGHEALKRALHSNFATAVAFGVVEQGLDTVHLARGTIDKDEYKTRSVQTVGSTGGAVGGAMVGAALGSVVPVLGTAIGAVVGGVVGGIGGSIGGRKLGARFFKKKSEPAEE